MLLSTGSLPAEENWVGFDVRGPAAFADYAGIVATPQVWDMSALFRLREQPPDSSAPYAVSHFGFWADLGDPWFSSAAPGAVFGELRMVFTTASVTAAELLGAYNADPDNPILQLQFVPTPGITPQQSFLLPIARTDANHQFALAQRDANGTVVNYSMTLGNQLADGVGNWLPYRHGHAIYDPARAFWVVDLTARERTPDNATHLGLAPWTPDYSLYPLVAVTLYLEGREAGHHFTVHSQAGSGPIVTALVVASSPLGAGWVYDPAGNYIEVPAGCASLSATVGQGMNFWITRDADDPALDIKAGPFVAELTGPAGNSPGYFWLIPGVFPDPPLRPATFQPHVFRVNAQRFGHEFTVWMPDGYSTHFGPTSNDPDHPAVQYDTAQIESWDEQGVFNPLPILTFTASLDPTLCWLRDDYTRENFPIGQTDVLDGWVPLHEQPPPNATISIRLPSWRVVSPFRLLGDQGSEAGLNNDTRSLTADWFTSVVPGMADFSIESFTLGFTNPHPYNTTAAFTLQDVTDASNPASQTVQVGDNDLRLWFGPLQTLQLDISDTRWEHALQIRHPNGDAYPILKGQIQGDTSMDGGTASFNSYGYFNATADHCPELPWYAEDTTTGERLGPNPTNADLINWLSVLEAPESAWAYGTGYHSIHVQWTPVIRATQYLLERRQVGQNPGDWIALPLINAPTVVFDDDGLADATLYSYRVYAVDGPASSLASELAYATTWAPGDGVDGDGSGNGGIVDSDNDGISDEAENAAGMNAGNVNTDNDLVVDTFDNYPNDARRGLDIHTEYHGVTDVNLYPTPPFKHIAVSAVLPMNAVGFAGAEPSAVLDPLGSPIDEMRVAKFIIHSVSEAPPVLLGEYFDEANEQGDPTHYFRKWSLDPIGVALVSGDVEVRGNMTGTDYVQIGGVWSVAYRLTVGNFRIRNGEFQKLNVTHENNWACHYEMLSREGHLFWVKREKRVGVPGNPSSDEYIQIPVIDTHELISYESIRHEPVGPAIKSLAISDTGYAVFSITPDDSPQSPPPKIVVRTLGGGAFEEMPSGFPSDVKGINDEQWIVGTQTTGENLTGFVWDQVHGIRQFPSFLPPMCEKQLRSCFPTRIANRVDQVVRFVFSAETLEGPDPGEWIPRTLFLDMKADETTQVLQYTPNYFDSDAILSTSPSVDDLSGPNLTLGDGSAQYVILPEPSKLLFTARAGFVPVENRVHEGFDPPMFQDSERIVQTSDGLSHRDETSDGIWWGSVGRPPAPFSVNQCIQIAFADEKEAKKFTIVPLAGDSVAASEIGVNPNVFTQKTTTLQIAPKLGAPNISLAKIGTFEVRRINPGEPDHVDRKDEAFATLNVQYLPFREADLGIYFVDDDKSPKTAIPNEWGVPSADVITEHLNKVFQQCCIHFTLRSESHHVNVRFDTTDGDGSLKSITESEKEYEALMAIPSRYKGKINLIILRNIKNSLSGYEATQVGMALGPMRSSQWGRVLIFAEKFLPKKTEANSFPSFDSNGFLHACAHEVGHDLTLAERGYQTSSAAYKPEVVKKTPAFMNEKWRWHDLGLFPIRQWRYAQRMDPNKSKHWMVGLMWPWIPAPVVLGDNGVETKEGVDESRWLRHEDWLRANKRAEQYKP